MKIEVQKNKNFLCVILFFFSVLYVYGPSLSYDFLHVDDENYLKNNPNMSKEFYDFVLWAFKTDYKANWHPLTWISWKLDYSIDFFNPFFFHLNNVLLHFFNTVAVFFLLHTVLERYSKVFYHFEVSCFSAFLFAVHPLHIESVVWISERKDLLYGLFYVISLIAYLNYTESLKTSKKKAMLLYLLSLGTFFCSILSKPMAISLPAIIILLDFFLLNRFNNEALKRRYLLLLDKLPFVSLALISAYMTLASQGARLSVSELSFLERGVYAVKSIILYFVCSILPLQINPMYPLEDYFALYNYIYLVILAFLMVLAWYFKLYRRALAVLAILVFVINLFPVLGLVQMGFQERADRYLYLALIVPCTFLSYILFLAGDHIKIRGLKKTFVVGCLICGYSIFLVRQSGDYLPVWENSNSYTNAVYKENPGNFNALLMKAKRLMLESEFNKADALMAILIMRYENELQSSKLYNMYGGSMTDVYFLKGMMDFELKRYDLSVTNFTKAIKRNDVHNKNYKSSIYYRAYSYKYLGDFLNYKNDLELHKILK